VDQGVKFTLAAVILFMLMFEVARIVALAPVNLVLDREGFGSVSSSRPLDMT